jgi:hypothetical protein
MSCMTTSDGSSTVATLRPGASPPEMWQLINILRISWCVIYADGRGPETGEAT